MTLDPRTIAAEIMTDFARDVGKLDIAAYIGQKYDSPDATSADIDAVAELIAKTGIDLIWPDGTQNTELDAARVDIDRLTAELAKARTECDEWAGGYREVVAQLTAANRRADGLHADLDSATKANTAWANENNELKAELAKTRRERDDEATQHGNTMEDRDDYHDMADRLADAIAKFTGVEIGEHSSMNDPWQNALDAAEAAYAHRKAGVAR